MPDEKNRVHCFLTVEKNRIRLAKVTFGYLKSKTDSGKLMQPPSLMSLTEDLVHDVVVIALDRASGLSPNRNLSPWLYTIAENVVSNYANKTARRGKWMSNASTLSGVSSIDSSIDDPLDRFSSDLDLELDLETRLELDRVLKRVADLGLDEEIDLIRRHHVEGASYIVLAAENGTTPNAMKQRIYRARHRLRKELLPEQAVISTTSIDQEE